MDINQPVNGTMETEFNLSDKRKEDCQDGYYHEKDVKEFIRLLKKELEHNLCETYEEEEEIIDSLAGEKLI